MELFEEHLILERQIQKITETNLQQIFGLDLVKSEFELHGLRIDTLAYNNESNAFVIIEYKKDRNFSVVDQGIAYLNLMLNNKADFILEYNDTHTKPLKQTRSRLVTIKNHFYCSGVHKISAACYRIPRPRNSTF